MSIKDMIGLLEQRFDAKGYLEDKITKVEDENFLLECPICERLKLYVRKKGGERPAGTWICFYCDESGGPFSLVRLFEGGSYFEDAEVFYKWTQGEGAENLKQAVKRVLDVVIDTPDTEDEFVTDYPESFRHVSEENIPPYFSERGISYDTARAFDLGYCTRGRYANRLIVPVFRGQELAWFLGRWMEKTPPAKTKKYLNSTHAKSSRYLYGSEQAKHKKRVILVEDVFSKFTLGISALATFGTHISKAQLEILATMDVEEVVFCWDKDAIDKAWKHAAVISELWRVKVVELPDARDPDELGRSKTFRLALEAPEFAAHRSLAVLVKKRMDQKARRWAPARAW